MNKKPILIATFSAIAIVVGVYLFGRSYFDPSKKHTTTAKETDKPGPTAKGHWHGDVWHDETHDTPIDEVRNETPANSEPTPGPTTEVHNEWYEANSPEWHEALRQLASLAPSEEEMRDFYREQGLEPPPDGYTYIQTKDGNTQLIKDGEPIVEIYTADTRFDVGYLSDEDWELYQALYGMTHKSIIETENISPEVVALAQKKKEALEQKAQGPIPFVKAFTIYSGLKTPADDGRTERKINEKLKEAYAQLGLRRDRTTYHYDYELINQLITEFQKEVQK